MREDAGSVPDEAGDSARWAGVSISVSEKEIKV